MAGDYKISDIYQGGYNSLDHEKGAYFTGFHANASSIGTSINPQTANQLGEVNKILNQGFVPIEIGSLSPQIFDQIPKQHFKEMGRVAELTGAKISVHAPIQEMEPSGITEQGWSEENRMAVERQLIEVVNKTQDLSKTGGTPITVHSTGLGGSVYQMVNGEKIHQSMVAINQETHKMVPLQREEKYRPEYGIEENEKHIFTPELALGSVNRSEWDNGLSSIGMQKKTVDEILQNSTAVLLPLYTEGKGLNGAHLSPDQEEALKKIQRANMFIEDAEMGFLAAFNKAVKYSGDDEKSREILKGISEAWKNNNKQMKELEEKGELDGVTMTIAKNNLIDESLREIQKVKTPNIYIPVQDFSKKESSKTFANAALEAYKLAEKTGKAPSKISIENMYPGMAFADAKGMNELVDASRNQFVETAVKNKIMSESEAKKKAKEIIGVTFDFGHMNIGKKYGFTDKDMIEEAKAIAKNVKHVHLADNFGFTDSHLPPGMGNVPNKELLEQLKKGGFNGTKIVEAGGFINQFKESPFMYSLEGLGAPMYTSGARGAYWNTSYGLTQGYFGGFGNMLPQQNYQMFGAGFSMLPQELGGNVRGGGNSRMGGTPLE